MKYFLQYLQHLGFMKGCILWCRMKLNRTSDIRLNGVAHPFSINPTPVDKYTLIEIFLLREYDIDLPASSGEPVFIVDGGANIGLTSIFFANKYPAARIVSIEPEVNNFRLLQKNAAKYANIIPLNKAIWYNNNYIKVKDQGWGSRGFVIEDVDNPGDASIPAVSIGGLLKEYNAETIDILKLDIEGSEKEVFESGYQDWLPSVKCLMIELHDRMKEGSSRAVFRAVSEFNFSCFIRGDILVFINEDFS
jgi:FkbM family methyltransferase